jgi:biopolymer transport protein ExbD
MAFKPSEKRSVKVESTELDLKPIMNMMCILIPLLLSCTRFVKNTYLELNLPPLSGGGGGGSNDNKEPEKEKAKIGLKLVITEKGMTIASNSAVLGGEASGGPTLPKKADGKYDLNGLAAKIKDITKAIDGKGFEDERVIIITAEDAIEYQVIVTAMDVISDAAVKELRDPSTKRTVTQPWFTNMGLGKIII